MLVLRSLVFNVLFYLNLVVLMILGLPAILAGRRAVLWLAVLWARTSLACLRIVCGLRLEVRGRENLPVGAAMVAAKHQSFWDVLVLFTLCPDFTFVLKQELTRIPLFGLYLARAGQIAIDRARGRAALSQICRKAEAAFAQGRQVVIFPEGTRRPPGAPPRYKFGVSLLYGEAGTPCLPVALNSGLFWPRRSFLRRPGTAVIEFLAPIAPGLDRDRFLQVLEERIETASDRLLHEALGRDPSLKQGGLDMPLPQNDTGKAAAED